MGSDLDDYMASTDCIGFDNDTWSTVISEESETNAENNSTQTVTELYQIWTPVLIFFCALTFLVNVFIVVASRWMRRPLTPTMYFSLSLAAADAIASLTVGLGLVVHSLLPKVYKVNIPDWGRCSILALEVMRLAAVIVTVLHLLALAVNHYIGIARPLHYAAIMTRKTATVCMVSLWIVPNAVLFAYFSSIENQGFQSPRCQADFILEFQFRGQYASFFFAPLFFMILIYAHVLVIIRRHQSNRRALTQQNSVSFRSRQQSQPVQPIHYSTSATVTTSAARSKSLRHHTSISSSRDHGSANSREPPGSFIRRQQRNANGSLSCQPDNAEQSNNVVNRTIKAVITTLLIVGTFIIGWIPAVIWFIVYCKDCVVTFESLDPTVTLPIGITVNSLIVLKSLLDPIIYTVRMKDFKVASQRLRYQVISKYFAHCHTWTGRGEKREEGGGEMVQLNRSIIFGNNAIIPASQTL